jgi:hypothetical protein
MLIQGGAEDQLGEQRGGAWMGDDKNFSKENLPSPKITTKGSHANLLRS